MCVCVLPAVHESACLSRQQTRRPGAKVDTEKLWVTLHNWGA